MSDSQPPTDECDLVMKGGITSGIVYPPAVQVLKDKYRFRSIGGTSAGAIAAAITAAAEYARETGGFERLKDRVQSKLSEGGFILKLFNPTPDGKPLLDSGLELMGKLGAEQAATAKAADDAAEAAEAKAAAEGKDAAAAERAANDARARVQAERRRTTFSTIRTFFLPAVRAHFGGAFGRGAMIGAGIGLAVAGLVAVVFVLPVVVAAGGQVFGRAGWAAAISTLIVALGFAALGALVGGPVGAAVRIGRLLLRDLPQQRNLFGLVHGHADDEKTDALTDWLANRIDEVAGLSGGQCLTFGMLRLKQPSSIDLQMVTTNLSHGRPYVLPIDEFFVFNEQEFRGLFLNRVVDHMVAKSRRPVKFDLPAGYYRFPDPDDLPVVVGMRMSLSFPLLIGAVPLYTVSGAGYARAGAERKAGRQSVLTAAELQVNWFSDGGISSNFPIHFFDAWLPGRPTFGITLNYRDPKVMKKNQVRPAGVSVTGAEDGADSPEEAVARAAVRLVRAKDHWASNPTWNPIEKLPAFFGALFSAAQNYRDTTQSGLPSYRERIVRIDLTSKEGGLNLNMPPDVVRGIERKGEEAGELIRRQFNFEDHQWARFLVLMADIEANFATLPEKLDEADRRLGEYISGARPKPPSYPRDNEWMQQARALIEELRAAVGKWAGNGEMFVIDRPKPEPVLRMTPKL